MKSAVVSANYIKKNARAQVCVVIGIADCIWKFSQATTDFFRKSRQCFFRTFDTGPDGQLSASQMATWPSHWILFLHVFAVQSAMNYVYAWILLLLPRSIEDRPTAYGAFRKGAPNNAMGHSLQDCKDRHPKRERRDIGIKRVVLPMASCIQNTKSDLKLLLCVARLWQTSWACSAHLAVLRMGSTADWVHVR